MRARAYRVGAVPLTDADGGWCESCGQRSLGVAWSESRAFGGAWLCSSSACRGNGGRLRAISKRTRQGLVSVVPRLDLADLIAATRALELERRRTRIVQLDRVADELYERSIGLPMGREWTRTLRLAQRCAFRAWELAARDAR